MRPSRLLRQLLREQRRAVAAGAVSGIVWMAALAAVPLVISRAVDDGVVGGDGGRLAMWLAALGGLGVAQAVAGGARHWLACRLYYGTSADVSAAVARRVLDPRGGVDDAPGELVSLVTSDAVRVGAVADLCCRGSGAVVAIVGVATVMVVLSPPLAIAVLVAMPVLMGLSLPLLRPLERRATAEQRARGVVATATADLVTGHRVLHGLGSTAVARRRFGPLNRNVGASAIKTAEIDAVLDSLAVVVPGALLAITVAVGSGLVDDGALTVGELVGFLAYAQFLLTPVATLVEIADVWTRGLASAGRLVGVLERQAAVTEVSDPATFGDERSAPAVSLVAVSSGDGALAACTLDACWGEIVAVTVSDGRAAAALASLLARERDPWGGAVLVRGRDARTLPLGELRDTVLVAHGDGLLIDDSVRENVAFGRRGDDPARDGTAMRVACVDEVVERLPAGADSLVGERGRWLSGGQRQRIGLARAIVSDAPVLVLVEPTSAVDAHTEWAIGTELAAARRHPRRCTVVVTASPALLAVADRVVDLASVQNAAPRPTAAAT